MKYVFIIFLFFFTSSCSVKCDDPKESFEYWTGESPPKDMKVIQARYWQSAHWTREYITYLILKPTNIWWSEFIKQNSLVPITTDWNPPTDTPKWFNPPKHCLKWATGDDFQGSRYFQDSLTGVCYVYEIQL
jgi:hypothetical protein